PGMRRRLAIRHDDRAAPADFIEELLGERRLAAEQGQHGDDAAGPQDEPEQREHRLAPVAPRLVQPGEERLEQVQTTRPSLIWMTRCARAATLGSWVTSTMV